MARHATGVAGFAVEHFWQNWPKAIAIGSRRRHLASVPRTHANEHELQGGEQKTHRVHPRFGDDAVLARRAALGPGAGIGAADAGVVLRERGAVAPAHVRRTRPRTQQLVDAAIEGPDSLRAKRESVDEYGWRHFGDIYADHENAFSGLTTPLVSHYNNQYDAHCRLRAAVPAQRATRAGSTLMDELARHVIDIDIYHTDATRARTTTACSGTPPTTSTPARSTHRIVPARPAASAAAARERAQLHHRPDAALLPDRRPAVARGGDRAGRVGHRHGRRHAARSSAG